MRNYSLLDTYLDQSGEHQSAQARDLLHDAVTSNAFDRLMNHYGPVNNTPLALDVGCGVGADMLRFKQAGFVPFGITLDPDHVAADVKVHAYIHEQEFMPNGWTDAFDVLWSRHCLEHSIMPAFTLTEYARVLGPNALLYLEVPAPCTHQQWEIHDAHRSVLTAKMWTTLIQRAGFEIIESREIVFTAYKPETNEVLDGQDVWYQWFARKKA